MFIDDYLYLGISDEKSCLVFHFKTLYTDKNSIWSNHLSYIVIIRVSSGLINFKISWQNKEFYLKQPFLILHSKMF